MIHEMIEDYILSELDNQVTIFDANELAEHLDTTERSVRQTIYLMQEKGHPIIHYQGRQYIYILDKAEPTQVDLVLTEARQKFKSAMSSLRRHWGLVKTLPLKEQMQLKEEMAEELNFKFEDLTVHEQQEDIEALIEDWNDKLLLIDLTEEELQELVIETV